jgi:hypothetical protein
MAFRLCLTLARSQIQHRCVTSIMSKSTYATQLPNFHSSPKIANIIQDIDKYKKTRDQILKEYEKNDSALTNIIHEMKTLLETNNNVIEEYDFEALKTNLKSEWLWLKNMHKAAQNIKGGTEFIKNCNLNLRDMHDYEIGKQIMKHPLVDANGHTVASFFWKIKGGTEFIKNWNLTLRDMHNHEIGKQIMDHPLVDANGHSGASYFWTFYNLQYIYKNGWNKWIQGRYE